MLWTHLRFLGEPWFVVPWYAIGALGSLFLVYDIRRHNTPLKPAMKWAWPIIVFFFSLLGVGLYFATARVPGIGKLAEGTEREQAHARYERSMFRRVAGAVIHCVAGDGIGIMTAMVLARAAGMSFWQEFWFEYAVGFVIGWLIFQRKSMSMMSRSLPKQLAMAFRAEFFSMLSVMGGMGAVMTFVTPQVVTAQPHPLTAAFWGFGMLGLLVGFVLTYPTNWIMVKLGYKHGMGGAHPEAEEKMSAPDRAVATSALVLLGAVALALPAWLAHLRERSLSSEAAGATAPLPGLAPGYALGRGLRTSLEEAIEGLRRSDRRQASLAMDRALRAAEAGAHSDPGAFYSALEQVARLDSACSRETTPKPLTGSVPRAFCSIPRSK